MIVTEILEVGDLLLTMMLRDPIRMTRKHL